ncbi:MAG: hypothetical protein AAB250_18720, partial [Bdellovibrionota bacterium]
TLDSGLRTSGLVVRDDGTEAPVTEDRVAAWEKAFPAVDVRQQLASIREWAIDNPIHRKTTAGVGRHIRGWLDRHQNSSRAYGRNHQAGGRRDRSGAPLPPPRKTDFRDTMRDGQAVRIEYDTATGDEIRVVPRTNPKGGKT